ncbi:unnamed protein product [Effrenium voratum]|nr:unnamed protein product [Effrenium voratum]
MYFLHSPSMLLFWTGLVVSARRFDTQVAVKERSVYYDPYEGLACYCKQAESEDQCPDEKATNVGPNRYRMFHSEEKQCCKLSYTSMFTWKGWSYKKQEDFSLCDNETKNMSESCCTVEDRFGSFSIRVSSVTVTNFVLKNGGSASDRDFRKSLPYFYIEDIIGATDFDGTPVNMSDAQEFARLQLDQPDRYAAERSNSAYIHNGRRLFCNRGLRNVPRADGTCLLRKSSDRQCGLVAKGTT